MGLNTNPQVLDVGAQEMGKHVVVTVEGELDAYSGPKLRQLLLEQSEAKHHTLVVDLSGLTFTDSSGIGILVGAFKRANARGGAVCLLSPSGQLAKLLKMTGLTRVFPVFTCLQDALDLLDTLQPR
jgi:anti-sigma B factor antagonist